MNYIIHFLKTVLKIGGCEVCADFSFKLVRREFDKKMICKECVLDIGSSIEL